MTPTPPQRSWGGAAAGLIAINDPEARPVSVATRATDGASVR